MKAIGLTGNIGSGKTTIARFFEVLGIAVFNADNQAKQLMTENIVLRERLVSAFGKSVFEGTDLNRRFLADLAFNDSSILKQLNDLVHPVVQKTFDEWTEQQTSPYVIKEAAILFESNTYQSLDAVICVTCPEVIRIIRLLNRDAVSENHIRQRINNQWDEEKKKSMSDFIINNDNSSLVLPQVLSIHDALK